MIVEGIELSGNELSGYSIPENMIGKFSGTIIALGSGLSVFEDIKQAQLLMKQAGIEKHHTIAGNLSYLAWTGTLEHLCSLHQNKLPHFYELSEDLPVSRVGHKTNVHCPFPTQVEGFNLWGIRDNNGTTSLFALKLAVMMGYEKILCCGMDLEGKHRFYDNPNLTTTNNFSCDAITFSWYECARLESFKKKVRGVSGKTAKIFGQASTDWLKEK